MTDDRMALLDLIEKGADGDLVRDMRAFAAERIMEIEVEARTGAGHGSRSPERTNHRNGYRDRALEKRAGNSTFRCSKVGVRTTPVTLQFTPPAK